jgi:hemoglobin
MTPTQDIQDLNDIKKMVDTFYSNVRQDATIGPVFNEKIGERWPEHLEKMYRFWQTILLDRWMAIFTTTIDSLFAGPLADEAKLRAKNMAEMFNYKIEYFRQAERDQLK